MTLADIANQIAAAAKVAKAGGTAEEARAAANNARNTSGMQQIVQSAQPQQQQQEQWQAPQAQTYMQANTVEGTPETEDSEAKYSAGKTSDSETFDKTRAKQDETPSAYEMALRALGLAPGQVQYANASEGGEQPPDEPEKKSDLRFGADLNFGSDLNWGSDLMKSRGKGDLSGVKGMAIENSELLQPMASPISFEETGLPYTTNAQELAMPSGEQLSNLTEAERKDWQNKTAAGLAGSAFLATLPVAAMGGLGTAATLPIYAALALGPGAAESAAESNEQVQQQQKQQQKAEINLPKSFDQGESYRQWVAENPEFLEKWGDNLNSFEEFRRLGMSNPDLLADVFGYGDFNGVDGWDSLYTRSGVDLSNPDTAVENLYRYWNDKAANIYDYMTNADYDDRLVGYGENDLANAMRYAYDNWGISMLPEQYAVLGYNDGTFDADDMAYYALMARATGNNPGTLNFDQLNDVAHRAGEGYTFGLTPEGYLGIQGDDGSFYFDEGRNNNNYGRRYNMTDFMNLNVGPEGGLIPYMNQENPLMDQYMIDSLMQSYNANVNKRKNKEK